MSKYVKELISKEIASKLDGIDDALLVDVVGMDANKTMELRRDLRQKNIGLLVVRKSLARRAWEGSALASLIDELEGSLALVWGAEDFVTLAKEVSRLNDDATAYSAFSARGGVMDGQPLTVDRVKEISKWPSREEQISLLVGQILGPGSQLAGSIIGPGGQLASQIKSKGEGDEE